MQMSISFFAKNKLFATALILFVIGIFYLFFQSCTNPERKISFNNTDIHFTEEISVDKVLKLGEFLIQSEFANGENQSIQLSKNRHSGNYVLKAVSNSTKIHSQIFRVKAKITARQCSIHVFENTPVDFHYCNPKFKSLRVIPYKS